MLFFFNLVGLGLEVVTKRGLESRRGQEVIRTHACAHTHVQSTHSRGRAKNKKGENSTDREKLGPEGRGETDRQKTEHREGKKRTWEEGRLGKQHEEEEEIFWKNRNPWRETLHPRAAEVELES